MTASRLALCLALLTLPLSAHAAQNSNLSELPRKAGVGQPLKLQGLQDRKPEVRKYENGTRTFHHSYEVLYGGKTLEAGKWTMVLHLVHRIEMHFQPKGKKKQTYVGVDNEVTTYQFVGPEEISIAGAKLQILTYNDAYVEFVEN